ncbi:MAG: tRNA lysidine(34) synthetase TilS [Mariniphaga sp.]
MYSRFNEFVYTHHLFDPGQKVLLAVSGGMDSMVLLHLFEKSTFIYGVVHCNFQLRGNDSDQDEEFVRQQVTSHGVPFFFRRFETEEHARINGISVEMAARELRYTFFEEVRMTHHYDFIGTAHHQDDLLETFFLNLSRKTGIRGLTGIKEKSGHIIRPLLFATRQEIEQYARISYIEFRQDRTNNEVIYQRNFIRHKILPLFQQLNPAFKTNLAETILNLRDAEDVYSIGIEEAKKKVVTFHDNQTIIHIQSLQVSPFPETLLFEILAEYNFNARTAGHLFRRLDSEPGKQFFSKTHRLVKDRELLFITPLPENEERIYYIEKEDIELYAPFILHVEKIHRKDFQMIQSPLVACLDLQKLEFPLLIRKWQQGDYFQPLGMDGFKKLSDFLIDEKVPVHEKENTWLLCSAQKIVWVMGHRIDNRFKITPKTAVILKIEISAE